MAHQPQIFLSDYSEKSVVLRSNPPDFFKPYSEYLTNLGGKWGPYLKENPLAGQNNVLAGWIFPKTKETGLRQGLQQLSSGQVPQKAVYTKPAYQQAPQQTQMTYSPSMTQQILQPSQYDPSVLQQALSYAQNATVVSNNPPIDFSQQQPIIDIVNTLPVGYQRVSYVVIKPEVGMTLYLNAKLNGTDQKVPVNVESVEVNNEGITNKAYIKLGDGQRSIIELINDKWVIPKYDVIHSISLQ